MKYPSRSDYCSSIRNPQFAFRKKDPQTQREWDLDSSLVAGKAIEKIKANGMKEVWSASGSFAIAFKYETFSPQKLWAVRCFYRSNFEVKNHYKKAISRLKNSPCRSYFVEFDFLEEGIRVLGDYYPILKMEWVEGENLKKFIKTNLHKKEKLKTLAEHWLKFSGNFLDAGIAHGDLQHGNVLIVNHFNHLELKLIDYDSLYFSGEGRSIDDSIKGISDYQHPLRKSLEKRCLEVDFFPQLVIYLSILALAEDKHLWTTYRLDDREGLLFSRADFESPEQAEVFQSLSHLPEPIATLAQRLKTICQLQEFAKIPTLETVLSDEKWTALSSPISLTPGQKSSSKQWGNSLFSWLNIGSWLSRKTEAEQPVTALEVEEEVETVIEVEEKLEEVRENAIAIISLTPEVIIEQEEILPLLEEPQPSPVSSSSEEILAWDPRPYKTQFPQQFPPVASAKSHGAKEDKPRVMEKAGGLLSWVKQTKEVFVKTRNEVVDQLQSKLATPLPSLADNLKTLSQFQKTAKVWTTREVAAQLGCSAAWCHSQRYQYPDQFHLGIHYHKDEEGIIQWTNRGIEQLRLSQSKKQKQTVTIPTHFLSTKEVSQHLGMSPESLTKMKAKYKSQFIEGVHYSIDTRRRYYWTPVGVEQLRQLKATQTALRMRN